MDALRGGFWGGEACRYPEDRRRSDRQCRVGRQGTLTERFRLYYAVHAMLRMLHEEERRRLADGELIEAGSHTVTHPVLSALSMSSQLIEIRQSKIELGQLLGRKVRYFAYAYRCCTIQTASVVGDEGFSCVCSAQSGLLTQETCSFACQEYKVQDWDGEELSGILSDFFGQ